MIPSDKVLELTRRHESSATNTFRTVPDPPVFVSGEGPWLMTESGDRFLDLVCGSATTNLGHGHPAHRQAIEAVLATGIHHTGTRLPSPFRAELYSRLAAIVPAGMTVFQLVNSGAEAIEAAIKAAQFATRRHRIVAFDGGYHGRTLGALSITTGERIRKPFPTLDQLVDVLPYPDQSNEVTGDHCLAAAEQLFEQRRRDGDLPAIAVIEAIQGVSGVIGPDIGFLVGLQDLACRYDIPLCIDEIWNGFGRTGRWFAFEHAALVPDLVVMGKALSGGLPLSAVAAGPRFLKSWPPGMHTSTFQGNPLATAMAVANIDAIRAGKLLDHVNSAIAVALRAALEPLRGRHGFRHVRVVGAMAAIELAATAEQSAADRLVDVQRRLLGERILAYGGGRASDCLMLLPPINIDANLLSSALTTIAEVVRPDH